MVATGHVDKGAIWSIAGDSKWAGSAGFDASPKELQVIIAGFANPAPLWGNGIYHGGVKYVTTKAEGRSLYGRKDKDGIVIVKTKQAILIGHYNEQQIAGNCATIIENLADYLEGLGY
jgi:profilin